MTHAERFRVAHLVPTMGIGGVEIGIARSHRTLIEALDYRVFTVFGRGKIQCGQDNVAVLLRGLVFGTWRPDILVTSLWWSHPFGALLRLFGVKWLAFFHNTAFSGRAQRAIHSYAWRHADLCLVDSTATGTLMRSIVERNFRVIPYIFPYPNGAREWRSRHYDITWVGRKVRPKRTDLVPAFMRHLGVHQPKGRLCLVVAGEIPEEFAGLDLGSGWAIDIFQSLESDRVLELLGESRFFLLTSDHEGMSMTTVEAVFEGCVPVVRPVGELSNYIGEDYELAIKGTAGADLESVARSVSFRWDDVQFATSVQGKIENRLTEYSTYTREFLCAVMTALRGNKA